MNFSYHDSFYKTTDPLDKKQHDRVIKSIRKFEALWSLGQNPYGLGLKHLRENFFEFRVDIHTRILFQRNRDEIYYLLYGTHNDVHNFLKRITGVRLKLDEKSTIRSW